MKMNSQKQILNAEAAEEKTSCSLLRFETPSNGNKKPHSGNCGADKPSAMR